MDGIVLTPEIKNEFESRIDILEKRLKTLMNIPKYRRNIHEWRCEVICKKNEIGLRNQILLNATINN